MATLSYGDQTDTYSARTNASGHTSRDLGATIFVWLAWAFAAMFWGFSLTTGFGIMQALGHPANSGIGAGEADAGGVGWMLINFVGVIVLGGALAFGAYRYATRDKRKDPMTEASTAALYDTIEQEGGDDASTRSPEERSSTERDAYRTSQSDLR
jgi:hypothetical protein